MEDISLGWGQDTGEDTEGWKIKRVASRLLLARRVKKRATVCRVPALLQDPELVMILDCDGDVRYRLTSEAVTLAVADEDLTRFDKVRIN